MIRTLIITLAVAFASLSGGAAHAEPYMGTVSTFAFGFCPKGWLPANGTILPIQQNSALFSLYGTNYGGNGINTFALPKANVLTAPGNGGAQKLTTCVAVVGVYPSRP